MTGSLFVAGCVFIQSKGRS
ncbi:MAG: hypothetical protein EOO16_12905 [Chitinophagaceae bacterium]|nr:MAG: hypothetical protein EOO16_12905 [Chitinophagaceae bacterium]